MLLMDRNPANMDLGLSMDWDNLQQLGEQCGVAVRTHQLNREDID
jgi:hypothetical protein